MTINSQKVAIEKKNVTDLTFGETITKYRKLMNLYQYELGDMIGKTQAQINHIEKGKSFPFDPECEKLAEILGLDKEKLLKKLAIDRDISQIKKLCKRLIKNNIDVRFSIKNRETFEEGKDLL
ncbi:MAG: helix-turn-helix transcriptional regulator [Candidatus Gracilibacteria bacterium]